MGCLIEPSPTTPHPISHLLREMRERKAISQLSRSEADNLHRNLTHSVCIYTIYVYVLCMLLLCRKLSAKSVNTPKSVATNISPHPPSPTLGHFTPKRFKSVPKRFQHIDSMMWNRSQTRRIETMRTPKPNQTNRSRFGGEFDCFEF